ncbi:MAG: sulfotransferase domain-containing protein [Anaerolineales bacterium]
MPRTRPISLWNLLPRTVFKSRTPLHRAARALFGSPWLWVMRWTRLRRELRRLANADVAVVSFPKSGRTWLMVLLSRLFQVKYGLPDTATIGGDSLRAMNPAVPAVLFTHGRFVNDMRPPVGEASPYFRKKLIFLARHPADTAVSYYYHVRYRVDPLKLEIKQLPDLSGVSLFEFMETASCGMPDIIEYLNAWAAALRQHPRHLLLRYEDLHADPKSQLCRITEFIGESFEEAAYDEAIHFASFEQLQKKERENFFGSRRLQARDLDNPESFKIRRGKIGGYRNELNEKQIAWVEQQVNEKLDAVFGYSSNAGLHRKGS